MTDNKERIITLLRATGRPGIEDVIAYLERSSYFRRGCYNHHKELGGLAQHSLEVFDHVMAHTSGLPADSIAIAALLHDLGKTTRNNGKKHGQRGVDVLDRLGFVLTPGERKAIGRHDCVSLGFLTCSLRRAVTLADMASTRVWKHAHPELCKKQNHPKASKHHGRK